MSEDKKPFAFDTQDRSGLTTCGYREGDSEYCENPGTHHLIFDGGNATPVVCVDHYRLVMFMDDRVPPEDEHMLGNECTMPGTRWMYSTPDQVGYCFVPGVDVGMMEASVTVEDLEVAS